MKTLISILSLLAFIQMSSALACGDKDCEKCPADKNAKTARTTKSGRKLKCAKCADHEEEKTEQKAEAKPSESAPQS